jgi:hypothetical protein
MKASGESADLLKKYDRYIDLLGREKGMLLGLLCDQVLWLHFRWNQFIILFANESDVKILNEVAPVFFRIIQGTMMDDTLFRIRRLMDSPTYGNNRRLTLRRLPELCRDQTHWSEIVELVDAAGQKAQFARDPRNRTIAHLDLDLALKPTQPPEANTRKDVKEALAAMAEVINRFLRIHFNEEIAFDHVSAGIGQADSLLFLLRAGLKAEEDFLTRRRTGQLTIEDFRSRFSR